MKLMRHAAQVLASIGLVINVAGCGRNDGPPGAGGRSSPIAKTTAPIVHASVAGQLGAYRALDFGKKINKSDWDEYRRFYASSAASLPDVTDVEIASLASDAIGREGDAFRRDELVKAAKPQVDLLHKEAVSHMEMFDSREYFPIMLISRYDMDSQTYRIRPASDLDGEGRGYVWTDPTGRQQKLMYSFAAKDFSDVTKKVPKDKAREIEAQLGPLRTPGQDWVSLPARLFATVSKAEKKDWNDADLVVTVDAVSLALPKHGGETLILIDGPDVQRP